MLHNRKERPTNDTDQGQMRRRLSGSCNVVIYAPAKSNVDVVWAFGANLLKNGVGAKRRSQ